jgi:hypothetical protein
MSIHVGTTAIGGWRRGNTSSTVMLGTVQVWPLSTAPPSRILMESSGFILTEDSGYILQET